jgi:hypothetical protein
MRSMPLEAQDVMEIRSFVFTVKESTAIHCAYQPALDRHTHCFVHFWESAPPKLDPLSTKANTNFLLQRTVCFGLLQSLEKCINVFFERHWWECLIFPALHGLCLLSVRCIESSVNIRWHNLDDLLLVWRLEKRIVILNTGVDEDAVKFWEFGKDCFDIVLQIGEVR